MSMAEKIAFQGEPGAYSHEACRQTHPGLEAVACRTFEDVIETVRDGGADLAMLPVENSTYGRVADIHRLLPESGLHIVGEAFVRVHINLLVVPGAALKARPRLPLSSRAKSTALMYWPAISRITTQTPRGSW